MSKTGFQPRLELYFAFRTPGCLMNFWGAQHQRFSNHMSRDFGSNMLRVFGETKASKNPADVQLNNVNPLISLDIY